MVSVCPLSTVFFFFTSCRFPRCVKEKKLLPEDQYPAVAPKASAATKANQSKDDGKQNANRKQKNKKSGEEKGAAEAASNKENNAHGTGAPFYIIGSCLAKFSFLVVGQQSINKKNHQHYRMMIMMQSYPSNKKNKRTTKPHKNKRKILSNLL